MSLKTKLYGAVSAAWKAYQQASTVAVKAASKEVLQDSLSPATAVFIAAHHLLGPGFTAWEPESLWANLDIADANRDKLLAAITLSVNPSFYWDIRAFGNTAEVFNDYVTQIDEVPPLEIDEMSWAVFEAELIFALTDPGATNPEFDDPVEAYIAACAHHSGMVLLPSNLKFAEQQLEKLLNDDARAVRARAKEMFDKYPQEAAGRFRPDGSPESTQVGRLIDAQKHVEERAEMLTACLRQIRP